MVNSSRLGIVGLGYVGLPLAVEFGRLLPTVGFDTSAERVSALRQGIDHTRETSSEELRAASQLQLSTDASALAECNVFIVTVPTPVEFSVRTPCLKGLVFMDFDICPRNVLHVSYAAR